MASALLIAMAGAADSFLLGSAWGTCLDIAGPHAGLVTGAMNTAGQLGAFLSPIILPLLPPGRRRGLGDSTLSSPAPFTSPGPAAGCSSIPAGRFRTSNRPWSPWSEGCEPHSTTGLQARRDVPRLSPRWNKR